MDTFRPGVRKSFVQDIGKQFSRGKLGLKRIGTKAFFTGGRRENRDLKYSDELLCYLCGLL